MAGQTDTVLAEKNHLEDADVSCAASVDGNSVLSVVDNVGSDLKDSNGNVKNCSYAIVEVGDTKQGRSIKLDCEEHEFEVGDFVWAKIKSHPWWPGQIYDTKDASEIAVTHGQENRILVAFFGDGSGAWCLPSQLIPFSENFKQMSNDGSSNKFFKAIREATDGIGRVVEANMICKCIPLEKRDDLKRQVAENTVVKRGVLVPDVDIQRLNIPEYNSADIVSKLSNFAKGVFFDSALDFAVLRSYISAFYYSKGGYRLPVYNENPVYIEGLEYKDKSVAVVDGDFSVPIEVPVLDPLGDDWLSSFAVNAAKEQPLCDLMAENESVKLDIRKIDTIKEGNEIGKSVERKKKTRKRNDEKVVKVGSSIRKKGSKVKLKDEVLNALAEKTEEIEVAFVENTFGGEKEEEENVSTLRERKRSKYSSPPYANPPLKMEYSSSVIEAKSDEQKLVNIEVKGRDKSDAVKHGNNKLTFPTSDVDVPVNELLSEMQFAAVDPLNLRKKGCLDMVCSFVYAFKSSTNAQGSNYRIPRESETVKKRKSLSELGNYCLRGMTCSLTESGDPNEYNNAVENSNEKCDSVDSAEKGLLLNKETSQDIERNEISNDGNYECPKVSSVSEALPEIEDNNTSKKINSEIDNISMHDRDDDANLKNYNDVAIEENPPVKFEGSNNMEMKNEQNPEDLEYKDKSVAVIDGDFSVPIEVPVLDPLDDDWLPSFAVNAAKEQPLCDLMAENESVKLDIRKIDTIKEGNGIGKSVETKKTRKRNDEEVVKVGSSIGKKGSKVKLKDEVSNALAEKKEEIEVAFVEYTCGGEKEEEENVSTLRETKRSKYSSPPYANPPLKMKLSSSVIEAKSDEQKLVSIEVKGLDKSDAVKHGNKKLTSLTKGGDPNEYNNAVENSNEKRYNVDSAEKGLLLNRETSQIIETNGISNDGNYECPKVSTVSEALPEIEDNNTSKKMNSEIDNISMHDRDDDANLKNYNDVAIEENPPVKFEGSNNMEMKNEQNPEDLEYKDKSVAVIDGDFSVPIEVPVLDPLDDDWLSSFGVNAAKEQPLCDLMAENESVKLDIRKIDTIKEGNRIGKSVEMKKTRKRNDEEVVKVGSSIEKKGSKVKLKDEVSNALAEKKEEMEVAFVENTWGGEKEEEETVSTLRETKRSKYSSPPYANPPLKMKLSSSVIEAKSDEQKLVSIEVKGLDKSDAVKHGNNKLTSLTKSGDPNEYNNAVEDSNEKRDNVDSAELGLLLNKETSQNIETNEISDDGNYECPKVSSVSEALPEIEDSNTSKKINSEIDNISMHDRDDDANLKKYNDMAIEENPPVKFEGSNNTEMKNEQNPEDVQNALALLYRKRQEKFSEICTVGDELALYEDCIKRIREGGEVGLARRCIESIINENSRRLLLKNESENHDNSKYEKQTSDIFTPGRSSCQDLVYICVKNNWRLPKYFAEPSNGKFVSNVTVGSNDLKLTSEGGEECSPSEARESAAAQMIAKIRIRFSV